jgi:MFS family permease
MDENKRKSISKLALRLTLGVFCGILMVGFADQSMLGPLLNPLMEDFFQDTSQVVPLGWVSFVFTIISAISMIIAGVLADRKSRKTICLAGCLIYGVFSVLTILVPHGQAGYVFFFITRALNGIGIGAIVPTIFSMVGDSVSANRRSISFAYISLAILVGRMSGFMIAGSSGDKWRLAYFMLGVINLILAMGLLWIREPRRGSQEEELSHLILEGAEYRFKISRENIKFIWSNRSNFWLVMNFVDAIPASIIIFLIFKYLKDIHNMGSDIINLTIIVVAVLGGAGTLIFGKLGDWGFKKDKRAKVVIALFCNAVPIVFMIGFLSLNFRIAEGTSLKGVLELPVVWMLMGLIGVAMFINQGVSPNWYSTLTDINLPEHRATLISIASFMDIMGYALGPLIGSYLATSRGISTAMWSVLLFWMLNVGLWLPILFHIKKDWIRTHDCLKQRARGMEKRPE